MNFHARRDDDVNINLTPLIDVVFLLLIFFMVSTTFGRNTEIQVQLPESDSEQEATDTTLKLVIDRDGNYYINNQRMISQDIAVLAAVLKANIPAPDPTLVLRADAKTPHQFVVDAMDAASRAGIQKIAWPTTGRDEDD